MATSMGVYIKRFLRRVGFGWPTVLDNHPSRREYENHLVRERRERDSIDARLKALEAEYGIPSRGRRDNPHG